ncbi:uncharacterized protein LOC131954942 [Physella acuta]|uniref:uncharacterized protein LOC131954942 n=1 Tax=Physella acuta TaxID=109671 RepID=UPI0027DACD52|nr:uncharacterized protein LOC131954942 [Physella acuta]
MFMYVSGYFITKMTKFVLIILLSIYIEPAKSACKTGWFGITCQYQCHCEQDKCDINGGCYDETQCSKGWFGPSCQYVDLVLQADKMEPDYFHLKDNDESTCESTEAFRLSWLLNHDLTWIRIVYMNEADANITLKFYYGQKSVSYTSMFYNFYDSFIDIYLRMENLTNSVQFLFGKRTSICDVRISGGRNMALKQTTWQIDTSTIGEYNSNNAVDGNRDPNVQSGSCSRTLTTKGHVFWNLVFNSAVDVYRFLIVNAATRREQLSNFCLTVYDKKTRKVNIRDESSQRGEFAYNVTVPTTRATKVTISINNNYQLVLCEVEIFGDKACPNNYFGLDCERPCNCGQDEDWCMSATGACSKGCRTGYKGVDCNEG